MGKSYDRLAIVIDPSNPSGVEYIVLEPQLVEDYGNGKGPKGGVITIRDGWIALLGAGEARLLAGSLSQGGAIPPSLILRDSQHKRAVQIAAYDDPSEQSQARIYLHDAPARLHMRDGEGNENVLLDGTTAALFLGRKGNEGDVRIRNDSGGDAISLDGAKARVSVRNALGKETIRLDGTGSTLTEENKVGPTENGGIIILRNALNREIVRIGYQWVDIANGPFEQHGMVYVKNSNGKDMVVLDGQHGDITLAGADCSERFPVADEASRDPGTVLVASDGESLVSCTEPYDRRVAGVVSGAGRHRPGIILDRNAEPGAVPIALVGKTYCKVDAGHGSIACGDLLTTSRTPGHAMRAADRERAFGSVLGKALAPLSDGEGLIPILVALQ
jgi:hypothetical protein